VTAQGIREEIVEKRNTHSEFFGLLDSVSVSVDRKKLKEGW